MMKNEKIYTNNKWEKKAKPFFTIITPVFNRENTLARTILSVENQTFQDFEYILIDDGSTDESFSIMMDYLNKDVIPVMIVKKQNGGVHSARNRGFKKGRGIFTVCIDSDDELLPNACKIFYDAWKEIPNSKKNEYWQIKALCIDQNGNRVSKVFPDNINQLDIAHALPYFSKSKGEQLGCRLTSIMKTHCFPEPEGVTFVNERIVWIPLEKKYRSYGVNEFVRIYHTEGTDHISNNKKKDIQSCVNALWNSMYELNNEMLYIDDYRYYLFTILRYCIMRNILAKSKPEVIKKYKLRGRKNCFVKALLWLPGIVGAYIYRLKRISRR